MTVFLPAFCPLPFYYSTQKAYFCTINGNKAYNGKDFAVVWLSRPKYKLGCSKFLIEIKKVINMESKKNKEVDEEMQEAYEAQEEFQEQEPQGEGSMTPEEEAEAKFLDMQDKYLRLAAEFDNYRKRTMKEKAELIKNGGEKVLCNLLPVLDDLERAISMMETATDVNAVKEGVELIHTKFLNTLGQDGLSKINSCANSDFNTDYHEAVALIPAPSKDLKGKILDTVQNGYTLNDKVIRHSKVVVGE